MFQEEIKSALGQLAKQGMDSSYVFKTQRVRYRKDPSRKMELIKDRDSKIVQLKLFEL